jgi:hypothetical protein
MFSIFVLTALIANSSLKCWMVTTWKTLFNEFFKSTHRFVKCVVAENNKVYSENVFLIRWIKACTTFWISPFYLWTSVSKLWSSNWMVSWIFIGNLNIFVMVETNTYSILNAMVFKQKEVEKVIRVSSQRRDMKHSFSSRIIPTWAIKFKLNK